MTIKDGIKFGIGYVVGQTIMVILAKSIIKVCENSLKDLEDKAKENE